MDKLHFDSILVDAHNDTMMHVIDDRGFFKLDIGEDTDLDIDISKAKEGGLDLAFFAAFSDLVGTSYEDSLESNHNSLALINALYETEARNQDSFEIAFDYKDMIRIAEEGKFCGLSTIEGCYGFHESTGLELVRQYRDLGVRVLAYVWNSPNHLGQGTQGKVDQGLSEFGIRMTKELNRLGLLIDLSHMNEKTFWDVIRESKSPVIASHSCAGALRDHVRNLSDQQLLAIRDNGGLVGVNYCQSFLRDKSEEAMISDLVDHIDHMVEIMGIDHVGLGSDFDGADMPADLKDSRDLPKLTEELLKRGYSEKDIRKILGENILNIFKRVYDSREKSEDFKIELAADFPRASIVTSSQEVSFSFSEDADFDLIIDGRLMDYKKEGNRIILKEEVEDNLFHVASLRASRDGKFKRSTRIFYKGE